MPFPDEFTLFEFIDDCPNNIDVEQEIDDIKTQLQGIDNTYSQVGPDYWEVYI